MEILNSEESFVDRLLFYKTLTEQGLDKYLPKGKLAYSSVIEAMEYSLRAGGKRLRPALVFEFCRLFGGDIELAIPTACAIEMVHTYSLIHDDLPCMDNDDMRRGRPSCHKQFTEDIALLAGDGLLTHAFNVITQFSDLNILTSSQVVDLIKTLSNVAGVNGMIGGQVVDLMLEKKTASIDELCLMHSLKTGAMITGAVELGCILAGACEQDKIHALNYGKNIGLAFQIIDDILDVTADEKLLGKPVGSDKTNNKSTFVTVLGLKEAQNRAKVLIEEAKNELINFPNVDSFLYELADYILNRKS